MTLQHTVKAVIRPGEQSGYVAECFEIAVVTEGQTLDETTANLKEAVALYFDGEDMEELGFVEHPAVVVTYEIEPSYA
ncbi:MAG: hypothetical protein P9M15_06045 [Candidatus Electryoneaceae bacterium]|nr:hypothetical protein [Candidatus Electryoneaceae bacterium]